MLTLTYILMAIVAAAILFFDWRQTITSAKFPGLFEEGNPAIRALMNLGGPDPAGRIEAVNAYYGTFTFFLTMGVLTLAAFGAHVLAYLVLVALIGFTLIRCVSNYVNGIEPDFGEEC
jgi:hypothetical protein